MNANTDFWTLLRLTQEYISQNYSAALTDKEKLPQLKSYIEKYLRDNIDCLIGDNTLWNRNDKEALIQGLTKRIYCEMAEYSILTPYLAMDTLEEININAWNDIAVTNLDGSIEKIPEAFSSPQHAVDIVKRLLHHSGMIVDNAIPIAQGHLPGNKRITALITPLVDESVGISCSIRMLHPQRVNKQNLIETEFATEEMVDFLCMCLRYGVSAVVAGATSSGKTTLLNALLGSIPNNKRVFSIESGSRELSLVRSENGKIINNVVHTLSRPSDNPEYDITQDDLVVASLRFSPDIIAVGEMRDTEAHSAVEAAITGHTVVSTVHASAGAAAHMRIGLLCQKRFPIDFDTTLSQTAQAFPLVIYTHKLENNARKIMDISECIITPSGERVYRSLYNFTITRNTVKNGKYEIDGHFEKHGIISDALKAKLMQQGVPQNVLERFLGGETV